MGPIHEHKPQPCCNNSWSCFRCNVSKNIEYKHYSDVGCHTPWQVRKQTGGQCQVNVGKSRLAKSLIVFIVTLIYIQPFIYFVGADSDSVMVGTEKEENIIDSIATHANISWKVGDATATKSTDSYGTEGHNLPASLVKATRVGAQMREEQINSNNEEQNGTNNEDQNDSKVVNPNDNSASCWGTMGCKKQQGKWSSSLGENEVVNSSSADEDEKPHSSLAGSAYAKIEARVMKGRAAHAANQRRPAPAWKTRDDTHINDKEAHDNDQMPPRGFNLAGRVVVSPSDGLSYFLDSEDNEVDWMMTIPYDYLECGPTIESTTEAFPLADLVFRHLPASASSLGYWTNLGGGITIEEDDGSFKYIDTDGEENEGHPKLVVALSPIEITVSGNGEESRTFMPGDAILLEDIVGKGHKMRAAPDSHQGQDMRVLMVSLPHSIHFHDWHADSSELLQGDDDNHVIDESPASEMLTSLHGFAPKHLHHSHRSRSQFHKVGSKKPCPFDYDSAFVSFFEPTDWYKRHRRNKRSGMGLSTYEKGSVLLWTSYLPSLRRTMLVGLGLSLTSSFIYCIQLLYPPLLVLWGGATIILGGALFNVLATRWSYRRWFADFEEEWRWKREVRRNKMHRKMDSILDDIERDGDEGLLTNDTISDEADFLEESVEESNTQ